jgi:hypothetical protein
VVLASRSGGPRLGFADVAGIAPFDPLPMFMHAGRARGVAANRPRLALSIAKS